MTPPHPRDPRDPRERRRQSHTPDALGAAVRLDMAADSMRAAFREDRLRFGAAASMGTHEPPLTAAEFAVAVLGEHEAYEADPVPPAEPLPPAPAAHLTHPIAEDVPAAVVEAFSSERPRAAWRSKHDPRSLAYGIRPRLAGQAPLQDVLLPAGPVLDQATAGATLEDQSCCTGCALVAAVNTLKPSHLGLDDAERVYDLARRRDEAPGDHTVGTSVNGAMLAAVELGLIGGYLWAFGTRDIAQTLLHRRLPVVVGIPWLSGMWETGPGGLVVVEGEDEGLGHCLTVNGMKLKGPQGQPGPYFRWQQSAGTGYGVDGFGWIHHRDLAGRLRGVGEAAIPTLEAQHPR